MEQSTKESRIRIGISHGDINGISYEIIIRTLQDQRLLENLTIILYGSSKVASYFKKALEIDDVNFHLIKTPDQAQPRKPNIINVTEEEVKIEMGTVTKVAGELALASLNMAMDDLLAGKLDALVTAPINKSNIQSDQFHFPGHTEYLASRCNSPDSLMLMVYRGFRIGVVTTHIPISQVPAALNQELILKKIRMMNTSLIQDFGIIKPRIALMSLNPHAGDEGLIGDEDQRIIKPSIDSAFEEGILAFGPYPADGFFGSGNISSFDGVLAMYHDQGMIPFKLLSYGEGVNFTAGLPVIRTSPAHGPAFDIAGKQEANPDSFRNAIFLASDIHLSRTTYLELKRGSLKPGEPLNPTSKYA